MVRLDVLRQGEAYQSMETLSVLDVRTGDVRAEMGFANAGLIRRDARKCSVARAALMTLQTETLIRCCEQAAVLFGEATLEVGGEPQTPRDYLEAVSSTTGIPEVLCETNLHKIRGACGQIRATIHGLTRGLEPSAIDTGVSVGGESFVSVARTLAAVLPSNSPGVHSLWIPAIALKVPVALKPGGSEPWTPYRLQAALVKAGVPREAVSLYPTDHQGGQALLECFDRGMVFGQASTVAAYEANPAVSVHGPGYSKVLLGEDVVDDYESHLDLIVASVLDNGGRSCINASTVVVPRRGREIAEALAARLGSVRALGLSDPGARLAAFASRAGAEGMAAHIQALSVGAVDCTAAYGSAVQEADGLYFMRPTVLWCSDSGHPLAKTEYPFPFVCVVEVPEGEAIAWMGPTLVLSALTESPALRSDCLIRSEVDRLHLGGQKTTVVDWTQPHQGNLFDLLYRRRSLMV
jgi:hypothetical protein